MRWRWFRRHETFNAALARRVEAARARWREMAESTRFPIDEMQGRCPRVCTEDGTVLVITMDVSQGNYSVSPSPYQLRITADRISEEITLAIVIARKEP